MLRNMRIGAKLGIGFGLVVALGLLLGGIALSKTADIDLEWKQFRLVTEIRKDAAVQGELALGAGVHHFKNFILRGGEYDKAFFNDLEHVADTVSV